MSSTIQARTASEAEGALPNDLTEALLMAAGGTARLPNIHHLAALAQSQRFWRMRATELAERVALLESLYGQRAQAAEDLADEFLDELAKGGA